MSDPCGWAITKCGCGSCWDTYSPEVRDTASALAIGVMWAATARQYGLCPVIVQPCSKPELLREYQTYPVAESDYGSAYIHHGQWYNGCSNQDENSGCCSGCEVDIEGPTTTAGITEITIDGVILPPASYEVMNGHILVRTDGVCWPTCVNYSNQNPPTFQVEYLKGRAIPKAVQKATERLACEWAKACVGNACALPRKMRSLTRQGVEVAVEELSTTDPGRIRTGIPEVDMIIALENPHGRTMASLVWSPDSRPPRVLS